MSEKYDVIIIGAGIGGLTCGCYLAKGGLRVLVIEQHNKPGGYCTSFYRNNFRFDTGPHYIGSVKRGIIKTVLDELELNKKINFFQIDPTDTIIMPENVAHIRANPYDTIADFQKNFPKESRNIRKFFELFIKEDFLSVIGKLKNLTFKQLLDKFFDDFRIKSTLSILLGVGVSSSPSKVSALAATLFFKQFILDPGYYPAGGIQSLPDAFSDCLKTNKGNIILNKKVVKILTQNEKIKGVMLNDGQQIYSRFIVSNADATETFSQLLPKSKYLEARRIKKMESSKSAIILFLGVDYAINSYLEDSSCIWISETYNIDNQFDSLANTFQKVKLPKYALAYFPGLHDPTLRSNKNTIQIFTNATFKTKKFWRLNKEKYFDLLFRRLKKMVRIFENNNGKIITQFGATPNTFFRFTNNNAGAIYGWESNFNTIKSTSMPQETSVPNLILAGHWSTSGFGNVGGIPGGAGVGRNAARIIYSKLGKDWPWPYFLIR
jgi:prolycopene isomerase